MTTEIMRTGPVPVELEMSARELSNPAITPEALVRVDLYLRQLGEAVQMTQEVAKRRTLDFLRNHGVVTETGTMHARVEMGEQSVHVEARIHRSGYDPKKVEQLLRAWDIDPNVWMAPTITYRVDETKLNQLIQSGTLKEADVEGCRYEKTYAVQKPQFGKRTTHE